MRWLTASVFLVVFASINLAFDKPKVAKPVFKMSRETTHVTEFLDKDGYPDYETALNSKLRGTIKPEDNACALLAKAIGPTPGGIRGIPDDYWKWLEIPAPPKGEGYFKGYDEYAKSKKISTMNENGRRIDFHLITQPWTPKEYPHVADWLKSIEEPLSIVTEAAKRKEFYSPIVSRTQKGERSSLFTHHSLPESVLRDVGTAFAIRAMMKLAEDRPEEAWKDLITSHRLARLVARGNTINEYIIGVALQQITFQAELIWLEHSKLDAKQLLSHFEEIDSLPSFPTIVDKIDLYERYNILETICFVHKHGLKIFKGYLRGIDAYDRVDPVRQASIKNQLHWKHIFQSCSKRIDQAVNTFQEEDRTKRQRLIREYNEQKREMRRDLGDRNERLNKAIESGTDIPLIEKYCIYTLIDLFNPMNETAFQLHERIVQSHSNLRVAFALAAFHADKNAYPAKLEELTPQYIAKLPGDLYSGKPFVYRQTDAGYILYAVGENEIDDGGKLYTEYLPEGEERGDDIGVRMPSQIRK